MSFRLFLNLGLLPNEFSVRIHFEAPLFAVASDDDLIVPLATDVVLPFHPHDLSAGRLFVDCLLDVGGKRFELDHFSRLLFYLRGNTESEAGADRYC